MFYFVGENCFIIFCLKRSKNALTRGKLCIHYMYFGCFFSVSRNGCWLILVIAQCTKGIPKTRVFLINIAFKTTRLCVNFVNFWDVYHHGWTISNLLLVRNYQDSMTAYKCVNVVRIRLVWMFLSVNCNWCWLDFAITQYPKGFLLKLVLFCVLFSYALQNHVFSAIKPTSYQFPSLLFCVSLIFFSRVILFFSK